MKEHIQFQLGDLPVSLLCLDDKFLLNFYVEVSNLMHFQGETVIFFSLKRGAKKRKW